MKKVLYIAVGCLGLALGAVGAVLPLLPAFPFLLLAAVCFGRSSRRLNEWFVGTRLYKNNLESFRRGEGMAVVTLTMSVGFIMMHEIVLGRIVLACVWVMHILIFCFKIKTLKYTGSPAES